MPSVSLSWFTLRHNIVLINKKSHNKQTDDPFVLSKFTAFLLLLTQTLNLSTLMSQLAPWMMSVVVGGLVLRAVIILKPSMVPAKWLINALGVLGCVVLATSAKQLGLLLSMLHLLSFAYVLKSIELDKRRDFYQFILLGMFLLATSIRVLWICLCSIGWILLIKKLRA